MSQPNQKRKPEASPECDGCQPRMRRRGSLPDLNVSSDLSDPKAESKKSFSLQELISKGFADPNTLSVITPLIISTLQPGINATVAAAVNTAVHAALGTFKEEVMQPLLDAKDKVIQEMKLHGEVRGKRISKLEAEVEDLKRKHNDIEQYGRRCNIRLNNLQVSADSFCESRVVETLNNILPADQKISGNDIERCHPIGSPNQKGNRQIIIKFRRYKTKAAVYSAKSKLKNSNVFMTEDFTSENQKLISCLVRLLKSKQISQFWSLDCKIYAKPYNESPKVKITDKSSIQQMLSGAGNPEALLEDPLFE